MRESEQGVKAAAVAGEMATTATDTDLLQPGHVVKERWKVRKVFACAKKIFFGSWCCSHTDGAQLVPSRQCQGQWNFVKSTISAVPPAKYIHRTPVLIAIANQTKNSCKIYYLFVSRRAAGSCLYRFQVIIKKEPGGGVFDVFHVQHFWNQPAKIWKKLTHGREYRCNFTLKKF